MFVNARLVSVVAVAALLCPLAIANPTRLSDEIQVPRGYQAPPLKPVEKLKTIVTSAVRDTITSKPNFKETEIAATLIDLRDGSKWQSGDFRGAERIYPASVVKMFYMAALERQLEDKKVTMTPELERGLRDMIVVSSNEATQYILDVLTGTSSGAELPQKQFDEWQYKRNRVNRWFAAMGYQNINANQKTFCEDAYGIEQQSRNYKGQNRNMLTTDAVARLLAEIVTGNISTPERTVKMMDLMKRDPAKPSSDPDDQSHGFTGKLLIDRKMSDAKLWSKAGWTSRARHDAAYLETADGQRFVLVIFTENHANEQDVIPSIAGRVLDGLRGSN